MGGITQSDDTNFDVDEFSSPSDRRKSVLDAVPVEELIRWCDEKPTERYMAIAGAVSYCTTTQNGKVEWTPQAMEMFKRAPNPVAVLETFTSRFYPRSYWGSRASIVESRLGLLDELGELKNASLNEYATRTRLKLVDDIARMRKDEDERDSVRDEQFE